MPKRKQSTTTWAACKTAVKDWPRAGLVGLLHELYELSNENRTFLHARLLESAKSETLDDVKRALARMLSPRAVFSGDFKHVEVKRIIDRYAKATDDAAAVADLLVTDLGISCATLNEIGDFEPMVDHMYAVIARLEKLLPQLERPALAPLASRLNDLADEWGGSFGWGISDELEDFASEWSERAGLGPRRRRW